MTEKYLTILSNKKQIPYNRKREGAGRIQQKKKLLFNGENRKPKFPTIKNWKTRKIT